MRPPYWYLVIVEAAVVKDGRYLVIVRGAEETHAPGALALPGGKVENASSADNVLEETIRREVAEETGVEVYDDLEYVESSAFITDGGEPAVDVVFLCRYKSGTPTVADPGEVAAIRWMTVQEVLEHPQMPAWTRQSIERAERKRSAKRW